MFFSTFFFSIMALIVKYCKDIPPYQVIYSRGFLNVLFCFFVLSYTKYEIVPKNSLTNRLLLKRGVFGGVALSFYFHSLYFLPISIASVLQRTNPLWIGVLGVLFYKEKYTIFHFLTTIISFVGVLLIMKPDFLFGESNTSSDNNYNYIIGVSLALGNAVFNSMVALTIRELKDKTNILIIVFYFNFFNLLLAGLGEVFESAKALSFNEWILMILIAIVGWIGQICRARALFLEKAFYLSIIGYFQVIFGYLFDVFLLNEVFDTLAYIGMLLIIFTMASMVFLGGKE